MQALTLFKVGIPGRSLRTRDICATFHPWLLAHFCCESRIEFAVHQSPQFDTAEMPGNFALKDKSNFVAGPLNKSAAANIRLVQSSTLFSLSRLGHDSSAPHLSRKLLLVVGSSTMQCGTCVANCQISSFPLPEDLWKKQQGLYSLNTIRWGYTTRNTEQIWTANGHHGHQVTVYFGAVAWTKSSCRIDTWQSHTKSECSTLGVGHRAQKPVNASYLAPGYSLHPDLETIQMRSWIVFLAAQLMFFKLFGVHLLSCPSLDSNLQACVQKAGTPN